MTSTIIEPTVFVAPSPEALPGTLLTAATVVNSGVEWLDPAGLMESYNCLAVDSVATFPCPPSAVPAKVFNNAAWLDGFRFAVYGGYKCKSFSDPSSAEDKVVEAFLAKESIGVARALMQTRFVDGATWDPAVDLTPAAGAVDPAVGLAILEGDAASKYAGVPTIHAPRTIGTLLTRDGVIYREGDTLLSVQGSKIASDGGYQAPNNGPTGAAPAAGEYWMYASGEVVLARSETFVQSELDRSTNETFSLVERLYVAAVDCYTSAVRVKVS